MRVPHFPILLATLLALGCSEPTSPVSLDGTWRQDFSIPGSSLSFTLSTAGSAVSGSGTWTGEACCDGVVSVTGEETSGEVHLSLTFVASRNGVPTHTTDFIGTLIDANTLSGTFATSGYSTSTTFRRAE